MKFSSALLTLCVAQTTAFSIQGPNMRPSSALNVVPRRVEKISEKASWQAPQAEPTENESTVSTPNAAPKMLQNALSTPKVAAPTMLQNAKVAPRVTGGEQTSSNAASSTQFQSMENAFKKAGSESTVGTLNAAPKMLHNAKAAPKVTENNAKVTPPPKVTENAASSTQFQSMENAVSAKIEPNLENTVSSTNVAPEVAPQVVPQAAVPKAVGIKNTFRDGKVAPPKVAPRAFRSAEAAPQFVEDNFRNGNSAPQFMEDNFSYGQDSGGSQFVENNFSNGNDNVALPNRVPMVLEDNFSNDQDFGGPQFVENNFSNGNGNGNVALPNRAPIVLENNFSNAVGSMQTVSMQKAMEDDRRPKNVWATSTPVTVQGGSLRTCSFSSPTVKRVKVSLRTNGRPMNANVDLWQGPDNVPQKMSVYIEDGNERPFSAVIATPRGHNAVAIRNTGQMEFPLDACVEADARDTPDNAENAIMTLLEILPEGVQGGAIKTYSFEPSVASVQILLETDGRPLNARIELLQGPNNNKQVIELYTEDGRERPFYAVLETPGVGNVIRLVNTAPVEFPMTARVEPYMIDEASAMNGAWDPEVAFGPTTFGTFGNFGNSNRR